MPDLVRHIEVELTLLPSRRCGRRAPIFTGFQGTFHCDGRDLAATSILDQVEFAFPGESIVAYLNFGVPEAQAGRLRPGTAFELSDPWRVIARGTVRRLVELKDDGRVSA